MCWGDDLCFCILLCSTLCATQIKFDLILNLLSVFFHLVQRHHDGLHFHLIRTKYCDVFSFYPSGLSAEELKHWQREEASRSKEVDLLLQSRRRGQSCHFLFMHIWLECPGWTQVGVMLHQSLRLNAELRGKTLRWRQEGREEKEREKKN